MKNQKNAVFYLLPLLFLPIIIYGVVTTTYRSSNASSTSSIEAESGTISGAISTASDTTASGGQYVLFGKDIVYPQNSGLINVKDHGLKGDGVTDDTAALQSLISSRTTDPMLLYFPPGTYLLSNWIEWRHQYNNDYWAYLSFYGAGKDRTILKLKDATPGFTDPANPKALLYTASSCYPAVYGKTNCTIGAGNEGYFNYINDLTIDTGKGNPGAIGVLWQANNRGTFENVRIISEDGQGAKGLDMSRPEIGPNLVKNVEIDGFNVGIDVSWYDQTSTLENITLKNQNTVGIRNDRQQISIRHLTSTNSVPAVQNVNNYGLVVLLDSTLTGTGNASTQSAVDNQAPNGGIFVRNVTTSGYASAIKNRGTVIPGSSVSEFSSDPPYRLFSTAATSLNLPIQETPATELDPDISNWADVTAYGATPSSPANQSWPDSNDDTIGIQKAIDSGKSTIYFPHGYYYIKSPIIIRGNVKTIMGFHSTIRPRQDGVYNDSTNPQPLFIFADGTNPTVVLDSFTMDKPDPNAYTTPGMYSLQDNSSRTLVLKNIKLKQGTTFAYQNSQGAGPLFIEDIEIGQALFNYPQQVWARQYNSELPETRIVNNGGTIWIQGIKTESDQPIIDNENGGKVEVLGGGFYPAPYTQTALPQEDLFINNGSQFSGSFLVGTNSTLTYGIIVHETKNGVTKDLLNTDVIKRGYGSMIPLYIGK